MRHGDKMGNMKLGCWLPLLIVAFVILLVRFQVETNRMGHLGNVQPDEAFKRRFEAGMKEAYRRAATQPVEHSEPPGAPATSQPSR